MLNDGTANYVYGHDRLRALGGPWYISDALGSVRQTLDDAGAVVATTNYDPWGTPQDTLSAPFGFTGELHSAGQVYLRARWYAPGQGRFVSEDPFAGFPEMPYSLHAYQYAYSNPVRWTDPTGWCGTDAHGNPVPCPLQPNPAGEHCGTDATGAPVPCPPVIEPTPTVERPAFRAWHRAPTPVPFADPAGNTGLHGYADAATVLDTVQFGLDGAGMLPGVGIIPDGANVCISVARGEWEAAGLSAGAMVPLFGQGVTAGKVVSRADDAFVPLFRAVDEIELNDVLRFGDYGLSPHGGGKYFSFTEEGARQFANSPFNRDKRMTITQIDVPQSALDRGFRFHDPGGGDASIHFADDDLPSLYEVAGLPKILDASWVPSLGR